MADSIAGNLSALSGKDNPATAQLKADKNSKSAAAGKTLSGDFQSFMLMLTTQLKNQDPTSPLDTNQFTQQLVMFTGVEQQIATNKNLETLIGNSTSSQLGNAVSYMGKLVEAEGNIATLAGGTTTFSYNLPKAASKSTISISDSTGKVVYVGEGKTSAGTNSFTWDGKSSLTGQKVADGDYKVQVFAKDTSNADMSVKTYTLGKVSGVDVADGAIMLTVGNNKVDLSKVTSVKEPPAVAAPEPVTQEGLINTLAYFFGLGGNQSQNGNTNNQS